MKLNIIEVKNISKSFPGVKALSDVSFDLKEGEILGIVGENGAGKSTLIKILSGVYSKNSGEIYINKEKVEIDSPERARLYGIRVIYQELNILEQLTVSENILLGELPKFKKFPIPIVNWKDAREKTQNILSKLNIELNPDTVTSELSVAQQQIVEIAKAISQNASIIIMDEPTASLSVDEVQSLFSFVQRL